MPALPVLPLIAGPPAGPTPAPSTAAGSVSTAQAQVSDDRTARPALAAGSDGRVVVDPDLDVDPPLAAEDGPGTIAASPHAMASHAPPTAASPTGSLPTASLRPAYTGAQALDRGALPRMKMFHVFGVTAPLGAVALSIALGGDRLAMHLFWAGAALLALCNVGLLWLAASPSRWHPRPVGILWIVSTVGTVPMLYYFGPYSAVAMVHVLGVVFISLGKSRWTSLAVMGVCLLGHVGFTVPMMLGWLDDVGVISSKLVSPEQRAVAEALIIGFVICAYALGRWARRTNATALAELQSAIRVIGDQQQALIEVKDDVARQAGVNEGRWTGHQMGSWKLGLVLGRGAMGEVYEGYAADGRVAAVKLLNARSTSSESLVGRFHREMDIAARLVSPHIVRVYELSPTTSVLPYIAMERLVGVDLATRLRSEVRLPLDELAVMIDHVARGLEVARLAGVVHRDLKPHNVFLDHGVWKILDFGVSKLAGSEGTLTGEGIVGTPQYMASEQASGGAVTHLADVYALGAIAYRCLTGRTPFRGNDIAELVYQVVHAAPPRPSSLGRISSAIDDVLAVAMAKDPRRRFPSALAFAAAFVVARRGTPVALSVPADAWAPTPAA